MRPPYAGHYWPADPPYSSGRCHGCGQMRPALAWLDDRAPDARLCGRCVPPDAVAARDATPRPADEPAELPGQLTIGDAL